MALSAFASILARLCLFASVLCAGATGSTHLYSQTPTPSRDLSNEAASSTTDPPPNSSSLEIAIILQALASIGSFGALIFLLWQLRVLQRQTRDLEHSIQSSTYQQVAASYIEINRLMLQQPELATAYDRMLRGEPADGASEKTMRYWLVALLMNHYENAFVQNSLKALPEVGWSGIERDCLFQLRSPGVAETWLEMADHYSEGFRRYLSENGIIREKGLEKSEREVDKRETQ